MKQIPFVREAGMWIFIIVSIVSEAILIWMVQCTGLLKRYHISKQALRLDSCVVVALQFSSSSKTPLNTTKVYPGVVHAIRTHAALSVRIVNESGPEAPLFCQLSAINVEDVLQFITARKLIFLKFLRKNRGTLWRTWIKVTNDNFVIFAWQHAIGDGQSGLAVLQTILEALNSGLNHTDEELRELKTPDNLALVRPIEEMTDCSVSLSTLLAEVTGIFMPRSWSLRGAWSGYRVADTKTDQLKKNVRLISLMPDHSSRLLSLCRTQEATLTGLLYTISISILSKTINAMVDS